MEIKRFISIAVPTYNSEATIGDAVSSCLDQSFQDFELVIVDDASTDGTLECVQSFNDARIRVVRNPRNLGAVQNWNRCIEETQGDFLLILHHDDWLFPDALENLAKIAVACPLAGLICLKGEEVFLRNSEREMSFGRDGRFQFYPSGLQALLALCTIGVHCSSVAVRREAYGKQGFFNPAFSYAADEEMWPRIARKWPLAIRFSPVVGIRSGGGHLMHRTWERADFWEQWLRIHDKIITYSREIDVETENDCHAISYAVNRKLLDSAHYIAIHFLKEGKYEFARKYLEIAAALSGVYRRPRRQKLLSVLTRMPRKVTRSVLGRMQLLKML